MWLLEWYMPFASQADRNEKGMQEQRKASVCYVGEHSPCVLSGMF